jgi:competence protein ComEC
MWQGGIPLCALALLGGTLAVQELPRLPPPWLDLPILGVALVLAAALPRARPLAAFVAGFAWCAIHAGWAFDARLPRSLEGRDFDLVAHVAELPRSRPDAVQLELEIESLALDGAAVRSGGRVRLSWYGAPVAPGACERWHFRARLRRPRGFVNPGGFDFERHALERGIVAVGYVRDEGANRRVGERAWCVDRLREQISQGIARRVSDPHDAHLLQAFAVGDVRGLDERDWDVARANGIPHLIAISGFHVGVAAAFGVLLVRAFWWLLPALALRVPARTVEAPAGLAVALAYGVLAGGSLPTLRTLLMIATLTLALLGRRAVGGLHSLALALAAILLADPLAVLSAGFWLSFVGVAILILCLKRRGGWRGLAHELGVGQWLMTFSLLPLTVWFFGQTSLVGGLSNLVAVPLVSFVIVPLVLLATLALLTAPVIAGAPLALAGWITHGLWWLLERLATWSGAHWYLPQASPLALGLAMLGVAWVFLPRLLPGRALGPVLLLPLLWPRPERPAQGAFEAWMFDVGQGLSILVRTRDHALLYDAGPKYPSGFDVGEVAVLPALRALGVSRLDRLLVSHGDNDHAGGAPAIAAAYPDAVLSGSEPDRTGLPLAPCVAGQSWSWDGVAFRMLAPDATASGATPPRDDNDRSCVLLVDNGHGRLLLTGDVSSRVETEIAERIGAGAPLVLDVPHHGSRTSSGTGFIARVDPLLALVSAGWRNRYGHPHAEVVARYAQAGVALLDTARSGAIHVAFPADAAPSATSRERTLRRRYWRE